jgi:hypothetical protein
MALKRSIARAVAAVRGDTEAREAKAPRLNQLAQAAGIATLMTALREIIECSERSLGLEGLDVDLHRRIYPAAHSKSYSAHNSMPLNATRTLAFFGFAVCNIYWIQRYIRGGAVDPRNPPKRRKLDSASSGALFVLPLVTSLFVYHTGPRTMLPTN